MAYTELWAMVLESLHLDKQGRLAEAVRVERDVLRPPPEDGVFPEVVPQLMQHLTKPVAGLRRGRFWPEEGKQ